jgi:hypothetical protein
MHVGDHQVFFCVQVVVVRGRRSDGSLVADYLDDSYWLTGPILLSGGSVSCLVYYTVLSTTPALQNHCLGLGFVTNTKVTCLLFIYIVPTTQK